MQFSNDTTHLEINPTCQIRCSVVTAVVWLEDDDTDGGLVFFLELAEGWDDTQDLPSTVILYQHSEDKTMQVSLNCLKKLKISTLLVMLVRIISSYIKTTPNTLKVSIFSPPVYSAYEINISNPVPQWASTFQLAVAPTSNILLAQLPR